MRTPHAGPLLEEFIAANRDEIISLTRARGAQRPCPKPSDAELANGIPMFLAQLVDALHVAAQTSVTDHAEIRRSARGHSNDLRAMGLTIAQVVHNYGDICQSVTELAVQHNAAITAAEFRTMNLCLDDAIAEAVTEFADQTSSAIIAEGTERLGMLAHELRNFVNIATLSFESISSGRVAISGSTGMLCRRSLVGLRDLIDRALAEVRLDAGVNRHETITVSSLLEEVELGAVIQAQSRSLHLTIPAVDRQVTIEGDRQILVSAVTNLLQNALKFSPRGGSISLTTRVTADRVYLDIEDECGGLPPGKVEGLFLPFAQRGTNRSGVGLGLAIVRKAALANGGEIRVRDLPGKGCVFTLELPRSAA